MLYIDSVILNMIERACRRFQRLTGRTNVWLALQLTNLSIVIYFRLGRRRVLRHRDVAASLRGVVLRGLFYVLTQTLFKESIEAYESNTYKRVLKGMKNPRRVRDALLRVAFLTLALVFWYPAVLVYVELHQQVLLLSYPLILLDDGRAVSGGVRSTAAERGKSGEERARRTAPASRALFRRVLNPVRRSSGGCLGRLAGSTASFRRFRPCLPRQNATRKSHLRRSKIKASKRFN